jgi:hypothetical protein
MIIEVGSSQWEQKATSAVGDRQAFKLTVKGTEALLGAESIRRRPGLGSATFVTGAEVVLGVSLLVTLIAVGSLGVVAAVCLYAVSQGYSVKAKHKVKGPLPFDDELTFDLQPA